MGLFKKDRKSYRPLADSIRPTSFDEFVGQEHIIGKDKPLRMLIEQKAPFPSLVFWGPPGCGKTTLAKLICEYTGFPSATYSAVTSGIKEIKETIELARYNKQTTGQPTILLVDEFHRFNRLQQDAFLPHVEDGTIILIGVTTENPSFEINSALLSRMRIFAFRMLTTEELKSIIKRAISDKEQGFGSNPPQIQEDVIDLIVNISNGDARVALNILEMAYYSIPGKQEKIITEELVKEVAQKRTLLYDKDREEHYNIISAFIKSMRGSDPDAAIYWLARMLEAGEDPLFIARRMVIFASEDIGNADPQAICVAVAVKEAVDFVGMPEAVLALSQGAIYLASAPKSNACYSAYLSAVEDVKKTINQPVPLHLRNPVTDLMKELGYGKGLKYPHSFPEAIVAQQYLPDNLKNKQYYYPKDIGFESQIKKWLQYIKEKKKNL